MDTNPNRHELPGEQKPEAGEERTTSPSDPSALSEQNATSATGLMGPSPENKDADHNINQTQMDIHHHVSGHKNRGWHTYFWEFIMLFMAVFLGFLAHYQLEHKIERERERKYIVSMVKDLYMDTVNFNRLISDGQEAMQILDSLIQLLNAPTQNREAARMYYLARRLTHIINPYEISDRTYGAMKTSGNIRLLRETDVADQVLSYYSDIPTLQSQQEYIFNLLLQYIRDVATVFDPTVFHKMYHDAGLNYLDTSDASIHKNFLQVPVHSNPVISGDKAAIQRLCGTMHYLYARILSTNSNVRNQYYRAAKLMDFLLDTYNLRDELKAPE